MRLQAWLPIAFTALALVGCGGDEEGEGGAPAAAAGADPALAIPADAPVYLEAVIRPEGEQGDDVQALLDRFLGDKSLTELLDEQLAEEGKTYAEDIEPWLGGRAGAGVFNLVADEPSFVVAVAVTDAEAAQAAISDSEDVTEGPKVGDVQTYATDDDAVGAVTDEFLLISDTQENLEGALETIDGGGLAEAERFTDAMDELPGERLGALYLDTQGLKDLAAQDPALDPAGKQILDQFLGDGEPITGALVAEEDSVRGEFRVSADTLGPFGSLVSGEAPEVLKQLPGESWVAFGYKDIGSTVDSLIETFGGAVGGAAIAAQVEQQTGLNLERDLTSWMGDVALFARGETIPELDGALVIAATDGDAAKAALPRIVAAARKNGAPVQEASLDGADLAWTVPGVTPNGPLVLAYGNDRVVLAVGELAAEDGLSASETIEDSGLYERAADAIDGVSPSFILDYRGIMLLAESDGAMDDPEYAEVRPYLEMLDLIVTGAETDDDEYRSLFAVKVKE